MDSSWSNATLMKLCSVWCFSLCSPCGSGVLFSLTLSPPPPGIVMQADKLELLGSSCKQFGVELSLAWPARGKVLSRGVRQVPRVSYLHLYRSLRLAGLWCGEPLSPAAGHHLWTKASPAPKKVLLYFLRSSNLLIKQQSRARRGQYLGILNIWVCQSRA